MPVAVVVVPAAAGLELGLAAAAELELAAAVAVEAATVGPAIVVELAIVDGLEVGRLPVAAELLAAVVVEGVPAD